MDDAIVYLSGVILACALMFPLWLEIYSGFDHTAWKEFSNPKMDAKIVDITSEKVKYLKNRAKFATVVTFSDGFQFITCKTKVRMGFSSYAISIDAELQKEIIEKACAAHKKAIEKPSKAVLRYMEEGQKREQEQLEQLRKKAQAALEQEEKKQQEIRLHNQRMNNMKMELAQDQNKNKKMDAFLKNAEDSQSIAAVRELWETLQLNGDDSFEEVVAIINKYASVERMYGTSRQRVLKMVQEIRQKLNMNV